jgi:Zn-dependent protease
MNADIEGIVILLVVLLFSMSLHEMMHAFAADWLGDDTARLQGRLSLNPIPHIDPFLTILLPIITYLSPAHIIFGAAKPVQVNFNRLRHGEFGGAIVGAVGPLTNLVIACVAAILFKSINPTIGTVFYQVFQLTIMLNVGLFVFNSIPWPPLDGSRVLYAFAPRPLQEVMENIERSGLVSLAIFIFLFYQFGGPVQHLMTNLVHLLAPTLVI